MVKKTIDIVAESISKKMGLLYQNKNQRILKKYLKPCVVGQKTNSEKNLSKIGGFPMLPKDFTPPQFEGQDLQFFCQINFEELANCDIQNELPKNGLLVIFMYLKNKEGDFTIPNFNPDHLKSFYFEKSNDLVEFKNSVIKSNNLIETKLKYNLYMDFPESGDFNLTPEDSKIDNDFVLSWELLPKEFGIDSASFKLLGYPTADALNTYSEWYFFEKGINLMTPGDKSQLYEQAKPLEKNYTLLLQADLESLEAIKLEDEFSEFGNISIGIQKKSLENKDFTRLLFKYTMS